MKKLIILGAGGHGRVVADVAARTGQYSQISFLDDTDPGDAFTYPYLGKCEEAIRFIGECEVFVAIGNNKTRRVMVEKLQDKGATIATIIAPNAIIGTDVVIQEGTAVLFNTVVNTGSRIGKGVIINTGSSVDHNCVVGDYAHIAVGARLCGAVTVGENTWIGAGATVRNHTEVCSDCMVGIGAAVVKSLIKPGTYIGVPAKLVGE